MKLMTRCGHCGATVEFVSGCVKSVRLLNADYRGCAEQWLTNSLPLCPDCYSELRGWILGLSEKEGLDDESDD